MGKSEEGNSGLEYWNLCEDGGGRGMPFLIPPMQEFRPEVLATRTRAETATMKRRHEMEKEMERHELERILTARPEDLEGEELAEEGPVLSPPSTMDIMVCARKIMNGLANCCKNMSSKRLYWEVTMHAIDKTARSRSI